MMNVPDHLCGRNSMAGGSLRMAPRFSAALNASDSTSRADPQAHDRLRKRRTGTGIRQPPREERSAQQGVGGVGQGAS